jgi:hypothetical protein
MNPTLYDIKVDPILSNVSVAYKNDEFIAEQVFPVLPTKTISGKYFTYDNSGFRKEQSLRAMGAPSKEVGYGLTQSTAFVCKDHALKEITPDELKEQAPTPLSPEIDAAENVTQKLLVEKEYDLAAYMASESNLTNCTTLSGTSQWSDYANSDPIGDIKDAKTEVHGKIFKEPNTVILGKEVYDKLLDHPDIIDRIKYRSDVATKELLARLFGVDKVLVGAAGYETATEGQTSSLDYIWGKHAWVAYITPRPGIRQVSFGYHFAYKNRVADKWYDKDREGIWVRVHDFYTREVVTVNAAYFIKDAIA